MKTIVIIPARLQSTRLPNKMLLKLGEKSVIQRTYEQCQLSNTSDIYIATDSDEIKDECNTFTNNVIMTSKSHVSGTDRIAEAVKNIDCDLVINVQGDEPFIDPLLINALSDSFDDETEMMSVCHRIKYVSDLHSHNVVKVIFDKQKNALYFSRSIIPHHCDEWNSLLHHHTEIPQGLKFYRHLGIYAYKKEFLQKFSNLEHTYLERSEKLEQLRVLEYGYKIKMLETEYESIGIDTEEDFEKARKMFETDNLV